MYLEGREVVRDVGHVADEGEPDIFARPYCDRVVGEPVALRPPTVQNLQRRPQLALKPGGRHAVGLSLTVVVEIGMTLGT